jgi:hypothetical protein|tara:strand:- start:338 stop:523 length:186 start_codon:yes stop_codon:yes gene_type:complete
LNILKKEKYRAAEERGIRPKAKDHNASGMTGVDDTTFMDKTMNINLKNPEIGVDPDEELIL